MKLEYKIPKGWKITKSGPKMLTDRWADTDHMKWGIVAVNEWRVPERIYIRKIKTKRK